MPCNSIKKLFGEEERKNISLDGGFWEGSEKVSVEENLLLEADFTEEEILQAVKGSYLEGAPEPDGFSFLFYQNFSTTIKKDFIELVRCFEIGDLNIERLNYAMIILIPKEDGARNLNKFRPINLINCSFKVFAKTMNNRLERVCD
jgi:hypothetical protein